MITTIVVGIVGAIVVARIRQRPVPVPVKVRVDEVQRRRGR